MEQFQAVVEFMEQIDRILFQRLVVDAGIRDIEIEQRSDQVQRTNDNQRHLGHGIDAGVDHRAP